MTSGTIAVPANAVSVVVAGAFGSATYLVDSATPSWLTEVQVSLKTATSFTLTFNVPAPAGGGAVDWSVATTTVVLPATTAVLAGTIVNNVRDEIPDPVYDAGGNPAPDADGGIVRASSLYRWLTAGISEAARLMGGPIIEDWTALAQIARQPWYALDPLFIKVSRAFSNQWAIDHITLAETDVIWPSSSIISEQSLWGYYRKRAERLEFGLYPAPEVSDPSTTLVGAITASSPDPIVLASTANFLSFGYVRIENEIVQHQELRTGPTGIGVISRGVCGTTAASHPDGAAVQHLGLWVKGQRSPARVTGSTSVIELPVDVANLLETYLLARCRRSENEFGEATALLNEFRQECARIRADPMRQESAWQIAAFGERTVGPLAWGSVIRP